MLSTKEEVEYDANEYAICFAIVDKALALIKAQFPDCPPVDKWLIRSHQEQFNNLVVLCSHEAPDVITESEEMEFKMPIEIMCAGVKWVVDNSLPLDVVKIQAGEYRGVIKHLAHY